ncbi:MAG: hypothetical protein FD163_58 [Hyphomonadaceae bacterium]|nr:MAG: hypothetical protein FD163_58 [Hyphomonadaceae bacterium]
MRGGGLRALSSFVAFVAALGLPMDALWSQNGIAGDMFSPAAYVSWGVMAEKNQADVDKFERFLAHNGVGNVLPTYQILRTASMAGVCNESAFYVPPQKFWPNIVTTLKFIRSHVIPQIGEIEAVSGYRNPILNVCARGAKGSAHAKYFALDLVPTSNIGRKELIARICKAHREYGPEFGIGLGFYNGTRFHIDSRSFRRWGADGRSKTSPCAQYDVVME